MGLDKTRKPLETTNNYSQGFWKVCGFYGDPHDLGWDREIWMSDMLQMRDRRASSGHDNTFRIQIDSQAHNDSVALNFTNYLVTVILHFLGSKTQGHDTQKGCVVLAWLHHWIRSVTSCCRDIPRADLIEYATKVIREQDWKLTLTK